MEDIELEIISESDVEHFSEAVKDLNIYRQDTLTDTSEMKLSYKYTQHLQLCA